MKKTRKIKALSLIVGLLATCFGVAAFNIQNGDAEEAPTNASITSLWSYGKNTVLSGNVDAPEYAVQGYFGIGENDYVSKERLPEWRKNGIHVKTSSDIEDLIFKNPISVEELDKNVPLISILPLTSSRFVAADFKELQIRLTDADDSSNYFDIDISTNNYQDQFVQSDCTHFFLGSSKYELKPDFGKLRSYINMNAFYGVNHYINYPAMTRRDEQLKAEGKEPLGSDVKIYYHPDSENIVSPYNLYYNPQTQELSAENNFGEKMKLYDLDDVNLVGEGNAFTGFKNGRFILSVGVNKMTKMNVEYMIFSVAGYGMNGESVKDDRAPSYIESLPLFNGELPVAEAGKPYPLYSVEFYDAIDGAVSHTVKVKSPQNGIFEEISGETFTPTVAGEYTLRYTATDAAGNRRDADYTVCAKSKESVEPLSLEINQTKTEYCIGEEIYIPEYKVYGGSGKVTTEITVERLSDGASENVESGKFIGYFEGAFEIRYEAVDYIGNTESVSVWCNVFDEHRPIEYSKLMMYPSFVDGKTVELPMPNAWDYTVCEGNLLNAAAEITVKGTGEKSAYEEKLNGYVFTPAREKFGDEVIVEYEIYCNKYPAERVKHIFRVKITEANYIHEYFSYDGDSMSVTPNPSEDRASGYVKFQTLSAQSEVSAKFINPLRAENFAVAFCVAEEESEFESVGFRLYDSFDSRKRISLNIRKKSATESVAEYNGKEYVIKGGWGKDSLIAFTYSRNAIYDSTGNKLFDLDGFVGFGSGKVWAEIVLENVFGNAAVRLSKLGSQPLSGRYRKDKDGEYRLQKFQATLAPEIEAQNTIKREFSLGDLVRIPYAKAYDVLSPYVEVTFSVSFPNGSNAYKDEPMAANKTFYATEYGRYVLSYRSADAAGNATEITYDIDVLDKKAPSISYTGKSEYKISAGKTMKIISAKAFDSVDDNPTLKIFVIDTDYNYHDVTETREYKFTKRGEYIIRYFAYDDCYNIATVDVRVTVA